MRRFAGEIRAIIETLSDSSAYLPGQANNPGVSGFPGAATPEVDMDVVRFDGLPHAFWYDATLPERVRSMRFL
jgi:hypothetical protein